MIQRALDGSGVKIKPTCGNVLIGSDQIDGAICRAQIPVFQGPTGIVFGMQDQGGHGRIDFGACARGC